MKRRVILSTIAAALVGAVAALSLPQGGFAANEPMVGGAPMYPTKNIIENAVNLRTTPHWWPRSRRLVW